MQCRTCTIYQVYHIAVHQTAQPKHTTQHFHVASASCRLSQDSVVQFKSDALTTDLGDLKSSTRPRPADMRPEVFDKCVAKSGAFWLAFSDRYIGWGSSTCMLACCCRYSAPHFEGDGESGGRISAKHVNCVRQMCSNFAAIRASVRAGIDALCTLRYLACCMQLCMQRANEIRHVYNSISIRGSCAECVGNRDKYIYVNIRTSCTHRPQTDTYTNIEHVYAFNRFSRSLHCWVWWSTECISE